MPEIITAYSLTKIFNNGNQAVKAVNNVCYGFVAGKSYAITGPSGCGKTTLINMIGLILSPTEGSIFIQSKETDHLSEKSLAHLRNRFFGYIAQNFLLVDGYSVHENIEIPLLYAQPRMNRNKRRQRIQEVIDQVGLSDKLTEDAQNLSGGQRQKVAIARALVNSPDVILADEPTGSLDSKTGTEVFELLLSTVQMGKTLIMVTHNQQLAQECDFQIEMLDGNIIK